MTDHRSLLVLALSLVLMAAAGSSALSQNSVASDSLELEVQIATRQRDLPFVENARALLYRRIRAADFESARLLVDFMAHRQSPDSPGWLTPAERLLVMTFLVDSTLLADPVALVTLLRRNALEVKQHGMYDDRFHESMRDLVRSNADAATMRFNRQNTSASERVFYNLLLNHLTIRGYRTREKLNQRVDTYLADYPDGMLAPIAREYLKSDYIESPIGAAISVGYGAGSFSDDLGERFRLFHGPSFLGEFYFYQLTLAGAFTIGVVDVPSDFITIHGAWQKGEAAVITSTLDAGYELRLRRLAFTPLVGIGLQNIRSAGEDEQNASRTGSHLGLDLGLLVSYRIPFDVGPHIDFRLRLGRLTTSLEDYDPGFSGAHWYIQFCFSLVQRPYGG